jgi:hypothetical protein
MMKGKIFYALFACLGLTDLYAQSNLSKSDMVKLDFSILARSKARVDANDAAYMPAYNQLLSDADALLKYKPVSVMDKTDLPPSGDKHDYMSIGPYWWPDPSKPGGVPYMRKDGEVNPEVKSFPDKTNMPKLCANVYMLSLAYYFSGNEKYAKHASKLIKVWFLDSATAMNPNLKYGQAIKGVTEGRAEGIIEARHFIFLIDAVELLKGSENFKEAKQKNLKKWMKEFLSWMQTSQIGIDEKDAKNNHGVWYDALNLSLANFVGDKELANKIVRAAVQRLDEQMDDSGYFPLELARTTSMHYTAFILDAFTIIAQLSENTETNFWALQTTSKKSLEKGIETLVPYLSGNKKWTWQQIKPFTMSNAYPILWKASSKYNCKSCKEIIRKNERDFDRMLITLL